MNEIKNKCCCFTGHRPEKLHLPETEIKWLLKKAIMQAVMDGYTTFISGMARGLDMWAAETVLELKKVNDISLIAVSPYYGFEKHWDAANKAKYYDIIDAAEEVKFMQSEYSKASFHIRNAYMVDNSARVIAAYNGTPGGTKNTVEYARKKGLEIINIL
ncbi:MAG: DUF1273 family protein [Clostridia bacterium]|nr:DUF1273 family protein [Clostridia bacterium]